MAEFRVLLDDRVLVESPRWHDDRLVFSDWGAQEIVAVDLSGHAEVVAEVHAMPFCVDRLPDGRLVVVPTACCSSSRLTARSSVRGSQPVSTKPWNDIVVDGRGNIYVNNIGFDFGEAEYAPGIIAHVAADGTVSEVADDRAFPNGMAVTQDGSTLIVAESYADRLTAYDIESDGSLSHQRIWAELAEGSAPMGSVSTPRMRSGSPACPGSTVSASVRAVRCWRRSRPTVAASPACLAVRTATPCSPCRLLGQKRWAARRARVRCWSRKSRCLGRAGRGILDDSDHRSRCS